jgi:hypothetical protein
MNISRTTVRKDVAGGLEVQIFWYEKRSILPEAGKRMQERLKENLPEVLEKEVWPPSLQPTAFWTILCVASLGY